MKISGKGKSFTELEKAYICKFYKFDGRESLADSLNRHKTVISNLYYRLEASGQVNDYIKKWDKFRGAEYESK